MGTSPTPFPLPHTSFATAAFDSDRVLVVVGGGGGGGGLMESIEDGVCEGFLCWAVGGCAVGVVADACRS